MLGACTVLTRRPMVGLISFFNCAGAPVSAPAAPATCGSSLMSDLMASPVTTESFDLTGASGASSWLSDQLAPVPVADGFHCGKRTPLPKNQSPKRCGSAVPAA